MTFKGEKLAALAFSTLVLMAGLAMVGAGASNAASPTNQPIWNEPITTDGENVTVSAYNSSETLTAYLVASNESRSLVDQAELNATHKTVATATLEPKVSDAWHNVTDTPTVIQSGAAGAINGSVYLFGGLNSSTRTYDTLRLNRSAGSWEEVADLGTNRSNHGGVSLNGHLYAVGGVSGGGPISDVERYDPESDSWTAVAPLPEAKSDAAVTTYNGSIFAIAGVDGGSLTTDTSYRYDAESDSWTQISPLPTTKSGIAAASVDGSIYVIGDGDATLHKYDPGTDSWSTAASAPWAPDGAQLFELEGELHLVGGQNHSVYDPGSDSWGAVEASPVTMDAASATTAKSAYIMGGVDGFDRKNASYRYGEISQFRVQVGPSTATVGEIAFGQVEKPSNGAGGGGGFMPGYSNLQLAALAALGAVLVGIVATVAKEEMD